MILIDKSNTYSVLNFTLAESTEYYCSGCTLVVTSEAGNSVQEVDLGNDISEFPERYNRFILPTVVFTGAIGTYLYQVLDPNNIEVERGLLKIDDRKQSNVDDYDTNYKALDDNDFIVYQD